MAWNNASNQKCKSVYDVLAKIDKHAGVALPDGKRADDFLGTTAGEILDFGQKVYDDVELWRRMPLTFKDRAGGTQNSDALHTWLGQLLDQSR